MSQIYIYILFENTKHLCDTIEYGNFRREKLFDYIHIDKDNIINALFHSGEIISGGCMLHFDIDVNS